MKKSMKKTKRKRTSKVKQYDHVTTVAKQARSNLRQYYGDLPPRIRSKQS